MITITVLTILTMGVLPLVKVSVKRQKEQQLRETLRQIRTAIDEFHRDTVGMVCTGVALTPQQQAQQQQNTFIDPRSKVVISDCTIFGVDNPDHYPPDLETLVEWRQRVAARLDGRSRTAGREMQLKSAASCRPSKRFTCAGCRSIR